MKLVALGRMEVAGVALVAGSLGWALHPAVGGVIAGAYLFTIAQFVGRER
ncbi:MAG: hypothetical protein KatS3mg063_1530 [Tepidiforma sp.]|nr:hypothetical protein [Tepidiforma sp.]GIW15677.1 MAG: hypothetical protein KatS3mg063_1530 [Tepidiforma sp.]